MLNNNVGIYYSGVKFQVHQKKKHCFQFENQIFEIMKLKFL